MHPFEEYLKQHNLEALTVSIVGQIRYTAVWNATKGNPITPEHAQKIRQTVLNITKVPYIGPFVLKRVQAIDHSALFALKKITWR